MITFPESILVGKTVPETAFYKDLHTAVMADKECEQLQKNINILKQRML